MAEKILPYAPWATPRERRIGPGVYVTTAYGYHALAAVLHGLWRKLRGDSFWKVAA